MTEFAQGVPNAVSPLSQSASHTEPAKFNEDLEPTHPGPSVLGDNVDTDMQRTNSTKSQSQTLVPSRGGTLKKKRSLSRKGSLKRSGSRKNSIPGTVGSLGYDGQEEYVGEHASEMNSVFFTPVPTSGNPTDILANRFQAWRKVLKDLITYFRDIQKTYEARSKSLYTVSNLINNISAPPTFLPEGGLNDATVILRSYHRQAINEGNKAKTIEDEVVAQLTGLRSDLQQKVKEIKSLSGDFKNNVDKEAEGTRKAVQELQIALGLAESDPSATSGKGDPFIVKVGVDRQVQRQIDEENYLHRAFLNLENSGRELESIVVGEIQKAYGAYAGIIKREADEAYNVLEKLQSGPLTMPKDHEWDAFVYNNQNFVDPRIPVRRLENIIYPGQDNPAASEVRAGMLERKSKYLKSYTPGWYVLSPTHLHEFKSPDRITSQVPIMSLYLADQKLGSHSNPDSSSHKFMLKGRQSGGMHRGHAWVFRAESHETMLAWYEDIKNLTEKTGEERTAFIRQHARSVSAGSNKAPSISDDGAMDEDEADQVPYSATASQIDQPVGEKPTERPNPGGRFPSALTLDRNSQVPLSPSSPSSSGDRDIIAAAGALPGSDGEFGHSGDKFLGDNEINTDPGLIGATEATPPKDNHETLQQQRDHGDPLLTSGSSTDPAPITTAPAAAGTAKNYDALPSNVPIDSAPITTTSTASGIGNEYNSNPVHAEGVSSDGPGLVSYGILHPQQERETISSHSSFPHPVRHDSKYGDWMSPAAGIGGAVAGGAGVAAYKHQQEKKKGVEAQKALEESQVTQGQTQTLPYRQQEPQPQLTSTKPTSKTLPASSQTVPPNAAWASLSSSSVIAPSQITESTDISPSVASASNIDPFVAKELSPVTEQADPVASVKDPAAPLKALAASSTRPPLLTHDSIATISDLHIPGEFPRKDGA